MASFFSSPCDFSLVASSLPYAIYRNKEGHQLSLSSSSSSLLTQKQKKLFAWQTAMYYKQRVRGPPIGCDAFMEEIFGQDEKETVSISRRNSVLGFRHENHSLMLHTAGKCFDHVVLRYVDDLCADAVGGRCESVNNNTSGFVLPLGGLEIEQAQSWGSSRYGTSANLILRSSSSLYHIQTTELSDFIPRQTVGLNERSVILDPVQKWDMTEGILRDMTDSKSNNSKSFFLLECGRGSSNAVMELHTICAASGPRRVLPRNVSIFPHRDIKPTTLSTVESMSHAQLCFLSADSSLYIKDIREKSNSHFLVETPGLVSSLQSVQNDTNYLFVGQPTDILLLDMRYPRSTLAQKSVPGGANMMRSKSLAGFGSNGTILMSSGIQSRQVISNCIHFPVDKSDSQGASSLIHVGDPFGGNSGVSWETCGWPKVGCSADPIKGMDIIFCGNNANDAVHDNDRDGNYVIVVQQSASGDVYAQELTLNSRRDVVDANVGDISSSPSRKRKIHQKEPPIQTRLPLGVRCPPVTTHKENGSHSRQLTSSTANPSDSGDEEIPAGLKIRNTLIDEDYHRDAFPLCEKNIYPCIEEAEIKRTSLLMLDTDEIGMEPITRIKPSTSIAVTKVPYKVLDKSKLSDMIWDEKKQLHASLQSKSSMTLHEVWKWFVSCTDYDCDVEILRQVLFDIVHNKSGRESSGPFLSSTEELQVFLIAPPPVAMLGCADGLMVEEAEGLEYHKANVCCCHERILTHLEQSKRQQDERIESPQSIEGLVTCSRPSCLAMHCIGFCITASRGASSRLDVIELVSGLKSGEKAAAREEAVLRAMRSQGEVSDVTVGVLERLKDEWD